MRIAVIGANGYVGSRAVPALLEAGHDVTAVVRDPATLEHRPWANEVKQAVADVTDGRAVTDALNGALGALYLVHGMGDGAGFAKREAKGAKTFGEAARLLFLDHVVYLGGLGGGAGTAELSPHLASRQRVGEVLADNGPPTSELRASVVLGAGSASYELVRMAADASVVLPLPGWARRDCQPIAIDDLLAALVTTFAEGPRGQHDVREVAGPELLPYIDLVQRHREASGRSRLPVVEVPLLPRDVAALVGGRAAPLPTSIVSPLVRSLAHDTVVTRHDRAMMGALDVREACRRALRGEGAAGPMDGDPAWVGAPVPELAVRRALAALSLDRVLLT